MFGESVQEWPPQQWPQQLVLPPRDYTPEEKAAEHGAVEKQAALEKAAMRLVRREQLLAMGRSVTSDVFVVAGIAGLSWAGFMFAAWLGIAIASIGLIIVGVAIDPPQWRPANDAATEADE